MMKGGKAIANGFLVLPTSYCYSPYLSLSLSLSHSLSLSLSHTLTHSLTLPPVVTFLIPCSMSSILLGRSSLSKVLWKSIGQTHTHTHTHTAHSLLPTLLQLHVLGTWHMSLVWLWFPYTVGDEGDNFYVIDSGEVEVGAWLRVCVCLSRLMFT